MSMIKFDPNYIKSLSREERYALRSWNTMRNEYLQGLWNPKELPCMIRPLLRPFYSSICDVKNVKTGWVTEASTVKGAKVTDDHIYAPQLMAAFFFDNAEKYLVPDDSFELFFDKFLELCKTIVVTSGKGGQNMVLSAMSVDCIKVLTRREKAGLSPDQKYVKMGDRLFNEEYCMYQEQCSDDPFPVELDSEMLEWFRSYQ